MCGRYAFFHEHEELERLLGRLDRVEIEPRYNFTPTQLGLVAMQNGGRRLEQMPWGLLPSWATKGGPMINARWETAAEKPYFRSAWRSRRCVVPASGWFEWREEEGSKQPYFCRATDGGALLFAGLWEPGAAAPGYAILTKDADGHLAEIHDRMPVLLGGSELDAWLDPETPREALPGLARDWSAALTAYAVDKRVSRPGFDSPEAVEPVR